mgnify:CR=1 FL=1
MQISIPLLTSASILLLWFFVSGKLVLEVSACFVGVNEGIDFVGPDGEGRSVPLCDLVRGRKNDIFLGYFAGLEGEGGSAV